MIHQSNMVTGAIYQGRNQANLANAKKSLNFKSDNWLTFLQARTASLKIKKGSRGTAIVKYVDFTAKIEKDGKFTYETQSAPRYYTVFNFDQTEKIA